jgi:hypothetical protein
VNVQANQAFASYGHISKSIYSKGSYFVEYYLFLTVKV